MGATTVPLAMLVEKETVSQYMVIFPD